VDVTVEPVRGPRPHAYALVRFDEAGHPGPAGEPADEIDPGEASAEQVVALESELRSTKENLQAMIEELETSNEEMQAANEELVASNEELQSTNEELHSVNEELYTVNAEYQRKIVELTELSADMENLLTSTDVHTIFLDRELCIRKYTPRMAETFHLMPQDVGRRIDSFTHTIEHPAMLDDLRAVLVTAEPRERQVRDRQGRWFLLRILPYRTATEVAGVVLTLIDIDRLRRAEAEAERKELQLASILRNSPNWVFMKDLQGRYLLVDEAFKRLVGCDPVGKTPHEIFPAEVADALSAQDARVLTEGREVETELTLPHPDGPHTYLSVMFPVRDETGRITSLGGIRTDITQLKQAEARAREAVAQRDRFLAVLSHELRNPLAAIVNAAAAIERLGPHASESTDWVRVIGRRSRHMTRLLEDLLDVARVTQNKVEVRREVFDLGRTVADVLEEVRPWMEERRLRLEVVRPGEPLAVDGDPARLQQCQVNLLMNAAKYTPDGGCVWYEMAAEEGQAVVRIRDTGIGMSADMLSRVFDLFVQADETLDRTGGGIGVGLTLVKAIVERHGGTVEARSNGPGLGSEFVVRLPLTGAAGGLSIPPRDPPLPVPRPLRLLLVEDDADIRRSLAGLLELDGYEVRPAADGPAALAEAERFNPDVALLDIGIPGMDGYELARRLRDRFPAAGPRLVALTGYGRPADRLKAAESGFDAHLTKPFDPRELARVLAQFPARSLTAPAPPG
jgi:two-component system CheB/CheR fusion protein